MPAHQIDLAGQRRHGGGECRARQRLGPADPRRHRARLAGQAHALLVLIWNDELDTAGRICDTVLADARRRGSIDVVAHASCLRSMIMRRLGRLEEAAADARLALDFKLATSPPLAVGLGHRVVSRPAHLPRPPGGGGGRGRKSSRRP